MLLAKRIYFWMVLVFCSLCLIIFFPFYLFAARLVGVKPAAAARNAIWWYGRLFALLVFPVIPLQYHNPHLARDNAPCIIVGNHQSFLDIYFLGAQCAKDSCQVVRAWPFRKFFFFAPLMRLAGYIEVEGVDNSNFINTCRQRLQQNISLVCFPEGTRSRTGKLGDFFTGIFRVALELGVPIVPLVYHNTWDVCRPGTFKINPQIVRISMLPPVFPESVKDCPKPHIRLRNLVRSKIEEELQKAKALPL